MGAGGLGAGVSSEPQPLIRCHRGVAGTCWRSQPQHGGEDRWGGGEECCCSQRFPFRLTCPQRLRPALLVLSLSRHTSAAPALGCVGRWPRAHSLRSDQLLPEAVVLPLCLPQATPHPCPVSSSDPAAPALRPRQLHRKSQRRETSTALRSQADAALTVGQTHRREALFPDSRLFCIFRHKQKVMG